MFRWCWRSGDVGSGGRVALDDLGLGIALSRYVQSWSAHHGVRAEVRAVGLNGERLGPATETTFYRIAQELLSNIGKHAHATQVDITLKRWDDSLILAVTDDGVGFDPAAPRDAGVTGGFGLVGLRERVALLGGTLDIDSAPDEGTSVRVAVPVPKAGDPLGGGRGPRAEGANGDPELVEAGRSVNGVY